MTDSPHGDLDIASMIKTDSDHPSHQKLYKTLDLLRLYRRDGSPVYFILEGLGIVDGSALDRSYYYDEHSCPINYVPVEAIFTPTDDDPHGVFEYVRSVWMTRAYVEAVEQGAEDAFLRQAFPETAEATPPS